MNGLLYPKKMGTTATNEYGDGDLRHVTPVTGSSLGLTGPTVSSRSYPKKGPNGGVKLNSSFNPQKIAATKIYVGGVD
jgi:hypothetical protein